MAEMAEFEIAELEMKGIGNPPKWELEIGELEIECGCADAQQYPLQQLCPSLSLSGIRLYSAPQHRLDLDMLFFAFCSVSLFGGWD